MRCADGEAVNDLFQLRFCHRMFRVFRHFAEDEAAQLRQILYQFAPLLLGEIIRKGITAFDRMLLLFQASGILRPGIERGVPIDIKARMLFCQSAFLRGANMICESCHMRQVLFLLQG